MSEELLSALKDAHIQIDSSTAEKIADQYILLRYVENFTVFAFCLSIILLIGFLIYRVTRALRLEEDARKWRLHETNKRLEEIDRDHQARLKEIEERHRKP